MSNFKFLKDEWPQLYRFMQIAEKRARTEPMTAANKCRLALEKSANDIFDFEQLRLPYTTDLHSKLTEEEFVEKIPEVLYNGLIISKRIGNRGSHIGSPVNKEDAITATRYMFQFLKWFANMYSGIVPKMPATFDEAQIPKLGWQKRREKAVVAEYENELEKLKAQLLKRETENEKLRVAAQQNTASQNDFNQTILAQKIKVKQQKAARQQPIALEFTEAQTRIHLIDIALKEAGWHNLRAGHELEFPVKGMPVSPDNPKGNGYVDYVLWGDDGKPLALIEAKRTSKEVEVGRHQATLYADCLEKMYRQRPIIFYSNGYTTKMWDDCFYNSPRQVHGFFTKEELRWKIHQRTDRKNLFTAKVDKDIAGRPYQQEAIKRVFESLCIVQKNGNLAPRRRPAWV